MAHHLPRNLLAVVLLLLAVQFAAAQQPGQPGVPMLPGGDGPGTKSPEPTPAGKELSAQEVDGLIERAFGKDCAELKRPVRLWLPDIGIAIAADKATVARDGLSVRFASASASTFDLDAHVFRGEEIVVLVDQPVKLAAELPRRNVAAVEVHSKNAIITLTPGGNGFAFGGGPPGGGGGFPGGGFPGAGGGSPPLGGGGGPRVTPEFVKKELDIKKDGTPATILVGDKIGRAMDVRFKFKIDPKTSLADLVPARPKSSAKLPHWTNEDLAKVSELTFGEPISKTLPKHKAMEATAHAMAKMNHLNGKKRDGFMFAMIEKRSDLRGLPFLMGDECRTREEQAKMFAQIADAMSRHLGQAKNPNAKDGGVVERFFVELSMEVHAVNAVDSKEAKSRITPTNAEHMNRAVVAALTQILMPESEPLRVGLAKFLATIPHVEATKSLARLALFSPEDSVRAAAIEGLKLRREKDYTDILMQGFRYPLPAVSKRAAEALVKLERKDLLVYLIEVLESPDPRLPARSASKGFVVRELVKVNHHRNCLLCHAPGNTDNTPEGVLKVAVPLPGEPLPKPSEGGGYQSTPPPSPDIVVRLDMTYLRQDFSVMMPVSDAHPWPELQRFDFLVRTRELTATEAQAYEPCCEESEPGRLSPYHRAALFALRELTGRDTAPTAAAWRKLLKL